MKNLRGTVYYYAGCGEKNFKEFEAQFWYVHGWDLLYCCPEYMDMTHSHPPCPSDGCQPLCMSHKASYIVNHISLHQLSQTKFPVWLSVPFVINAMS